MTYHNEMLPTAHDAVLAIVDVAVVSLASEKQVAVDFLDKLIAALERRRAKLDERIEHFNT